MVYTNLNYYPLTEGRYASFPSSVLSWVIYYFCLHPECQEKFFNEIEENVNDDETITMEHMKNLTYVIFDC